LKTFTSHVLELALSSTDRHHSWRILPLHLLNSLPGYLEEFQADLRDDSFECMLEANIIHGDLNPSNIIGSMDFDGWKPTQLIDFGDARFCLDSKCDAFFDFVPLYATIFSCQNPRFSRFLDQYCGHSRKGFNTYIATCYTLIWPYRGIVDAVMAHLPWLRSCKSWREFEQELWHRIKVE